ncbi:hypothetical protein BV25DRAFT_1768888, partial [Artomyces pyxidatus]
RRDFCSPDLVDMESRLRKAAMGDALDNVRHQLRFRTYMNKWKIRNVKGQRPNTRARATQAKIEDAVKQAVETYRLNRKAYGALVPEGVWQDTYKDLWDEDLRGLGERLVRELENASAEWVRDFVQDRNGGTASGESRYVLPWIWYSAGQGLGSDDDQVGDDLKVEWFRTRARAKRWTEEVIFVVEEMRRCIQTCCWRAEWWVQRGTHRSQPEDPILLGGLLSYASKQAHM